MSTKPVTPQQAVAAVGGDFKKVATDAVTAYHNLVPEMKADLHQALVDLEATYGVLFAPFRALFPPATPPTPDSNPTKAA